MHKDNEQVSVVDHGDVFDQRVVAENMKEVK